MKVWLLSYALLVTLFFALCVAPLTAGSVEATSTLLHEAPSGFFPVVYVSGSEYEMGYQ